MSKATYSNTSFPYLSQYDHGQPVDAGQLDDLHQRRQRQPDRLWQQLCGNLQPTQPDHFIKRSQWQPDPSIYRRGLHRTDLDRGSHVATYTYNALGLGTEKTSSGTIAYTRDNKGNLVSERTSSGNYYFLFDGVGSVVGLMDDSDNLVNSYVYDPYGVTEHQTGSQYNPWQFAGGYFDASTLYYKFGTRYYDRFGRWTQKDPVPSMNPYVYAGDDPVNEVDSRSKDSAIESFLTKGLFHQVISALIC